ncbi:MAG: translation initiation factor IF-2 [Lachnospiraceae bacterium]
MPKKRVYEVAKALNKANSDIISALQKKGVEIKSHMSTLSEEHVTWLNDYFNKKRPEKSEAAKNMMRKKEEKDTRTPREERNNKGPRENRDGARQKSDGNKGQRENREGTRQKMDGNKGPRENREGKRDSKENNTRTENRGPKKWNNNNQGSRQERPDNRQGGRVNNDNQGRNNNRDGRNRDRDRDRDFGKDQSNVLSEFQNSQRRNSKKSSSNEFVKSDKNERRERLDRNNEKLTRADRLESQMEDGRPDKSRGGKNSFKNKNQKNNKNKNNKNTMWEKPIKPKQAPAPAPKEPEEEKIKTIALPESMTVGELATAIKTPAGTIIKKLFLEGKMLTVNSELSFEQAEEIALEYNYIAEKEEVVDVIEELLKEDDEDEDLMEERSPVVCVMGHVDHGKTSLLDAIRQTRVTAGEAGGITQHIGAYVVNVGDQKITFLDTPGHEAFTSMRMRGAQSTDIAILVVAADDGVMPQTVEAINHAKAAGVEIIVAVNKIDKESANVERVKQELMEYELVAEDWGGQTAFVPVSAHTKEGIEDLLEMITLTAEMLELKANPNRNARGIVIEAKLDKGKGPVATILVQKGTLKVGDSVSIGSTYGKIRAMVDDKGKNIKKAGPSTPVEILGLNEVPFAGEIMMAMDSEKEARTTAEAFFAYNREKLLADTKSKMSLDDLFDQIQAGNVKELNIVVKADVQGSVEAVKQSLVKLSNDEVVIKVIHGGVGAINESDVILASASNAIIIGFNVRPDNMAKSIAEQEKVDLRLYRVIYNAIEDIEAAMKGMLDPVYEEKITGHAEVRTTFKASGVGTIAGSFVKDGVVSRNSKVRIVRDGIVIYEGTLASLKRFKDDVKEVRAGFECGLVFEKYNDVKEGDQIEAFVMEEIPR